MAGTDTIFAIATPPGAGGVGVIRLSGPQARSISREVTGRALAPRVAVFCSFRDKDGSTIDTGIALSFPAPASFTGEDVVELQGHGSPVVQQMLSRRLAALGARPARPGEFSERAFMNDKLDLAQAEAIADLVSAGSESAARAAQRSLAGDFSNRVEALVARLTELRVFIEAALDFPDEEIDFIAESDVLERLDRVIADLAEVRVTAQRGQVLRDGVTVAIIGQPNAGKSSLLNALAGRDAAIVTDIPGTTRDVLRETLSLDGLPVHIADTAGIRESSDIVEAEGIRRARAALAVADIALLVIDASADIDAQRELLSEVPAGTTIIEVLNKADLAGLDITVDDPANRVTLSAKSDEGVGGLVRLLCRVAGLGGETDGTFSARTRHLDALARAQAHLVDGREQLTDFGSAETLAESLRLAQTALGEITGQVLADDLLGAIFSSFCIGK